MSTAGTAHRHQPPKGATNHEAEAHVSIEPLERAYADPSLPGAFEQVFRVFFPMGSRREMRWTPCPQSFARKSHV
jgi:hypothetical protein